jgi:hypothetical protein
MSKCILLQKVVFAAVSRDFELGSESIRCAFLLGFLAALQDPFHVTVKIERPLVQITCCDRHQGTAAVNVNARHADGVDTLVDVSFVILSRIWIVRGIFVEGVVFPGFTFQTSGTAITIYGARLKKEKLCA